MRILILATIAFLQFVPFLEGKSQVDEANTTYIQHPAVSDRVWKEMKPYFLPDDHPIKAKLDRIFSQARASLDCESLLEAGFRNCEKGRFSGTVVTTHPQLKGYVIKLFRDDQKRYNDSSKLMRRIKGAKVIQDAIDHYGYQNLFKVPKKWIYPLPIKPEPPHKYKQKFFILIAEDCQILNKPDNLKKWKSKAVTKELLLAFYKLLKTEGLNDCILIKNSPFSKDGKIAFIDTELYHNWPVHYDKLYRVLSDQASDYWQELLQKAYSEGFY